MCSGLIPADTITLLYFSCPLWDAELNTGGSAVIFLHFPNFTTVLHPRILCKDTASQITMTRVCATELPNSFSSKITLTRREVPLSLQSTTQENPDSKCLPPPWWKLQAEALGAAAWIGGPYPKQTSFFRHCYFPVWLLFLMHPPPWESLKEGRKEKEQKTKNYPLL